MIKSFCIVRIHTCVIRKKNMSHVRMIFIEFIIQKQDPGEYVLLLSGRVTNV